MTEPRPMIIRTDVFQGTVAELLLHVDALGLTAADVELRHCRLKYETPQTDDEARAQAEWQARHDVRTEEWERKTLVRLRAKYGQHE